MDGVDILHLEHREKSEMDYSFFFGRLLIVFLSFLFLNPDKKNDRCNDRQTNIHAPLIHLYNY